MHYLIGPFLLLALNGVDFCCVVLQGPMEKGPFINEGPENWSSLLKKALTFQHLFSLAHTIF